LLPGSRRVRVATAGSSAQREEELLHMRWSVNIKYVFFCNMFYYQPEVIAIGGEKN